MVIWPVSVAIHDRVQHVTYEYEVRPPLQAEFIGQKGQAHSKNQLIERWNIRVDVASSGGP